MEQTEKKARRLSLLFVAMVVIIVGAIIASVIATPYDTGILMGTSLSGNNQHGGQVAYTTDYLFYVSDGQIMQYDKGNDETQSVYEGEISHLNPFDGWLYFVEAGKIQRIAYYGGLKTQIGTAENVTMMSVNGLWIYYLDENGALGKVRSDGKKQSALTDGSIHFTAFEAANRVLLATDGKNIYRMNTDGTNCSVLAQGSNISMMVYTLDNLFYCDNGQIKLIESVAAGQDNGTAYGGVSATLFNYDVDSENRGMLYYVSGDELRVRKLESVVHDSEEDLLLTQAPGITDLYSIESDLYYHDAEGKLMRVRINDSECTVEAVK